MSIFDLNPEIHSDWVANFEDLKLRGTFTRETRHRAKDGRVFPVEVSANYVHMGGQALGLTFVRDITARPAAADRISGAAALPDRALRRIPVRRLAGLFFAFPAKVRRAHAGGVRSEGAPA